jgi:DNA-binding transcriptional ArsR family regulator
MRDKPERPGGALPQRELRDPMALRAMAHPVRLNIMEELAASGPATATELSERIGESAANCSWHLRQLARYGFIEEAEGGTGRQRPWQVVMESQRIVSGDGEPELAAAGDAVGAMIQARAYDALRAWYGRRRSEPQQWRDASFSNYSLMWLTAEELAGIEDQVFEISTRHSERLTDPSSRPPGARLVSLVSWAFPMRPQAGPVVGAAAFDPIADEAPVTDNPPA